MLSLTNHHKPLCDDIALAINELGYRIVATTGTHNYLKEKGIESKHIENFDLKKIQQNMKDGKYFGKKRSIYDKY